MTGSRPAGECYQALAVAEGMPYGLARTALVEEVVAEADALGDRPLAVEARLDLCTAYSYGGEPLKRLPVFAWLLARHDEHPFDGGHLHRLLWQYKWMTTGVLEHPDIPLSTIMSTLADMERRYTDEGEGLGPVLGCRYQVAAHVHGAHAAQGDYLAWTRAPRTQLSDCRACEPTVRTRHLTLTGRHDEAVAEALPVLSGEITCAEQPAAMISVALESLVLTGRAGRAATEHLRGVRQTRHDPSGTMLWARYLHVLTRSGRLQRATDLLAERLHELDAPPTPEAGMHLAAAAAGLLTRLTEKGWGDVVLVPHRPGSTVPGPTPVADLVEPLRLQALHDAARFDTRNGTDAVGAQIRAWLDPAPLPDLPLDLLPDATVPRRSGRRAAEDPASEPAPTGRRAAWPTPPTPASGLPSISPVPGSVPDPAAEPGSLAELAAALEAARQSGDRRLRAQTLQRWRVRREELLGPQRAGTTAPPWDPADADRQRALDAARLDCAAALDDLEDDPSRLHATRALGARLHDAGDEAGAYRFELWWLREAVLAGLMAPDQALRAADDVVSEVRTGLGPADQGTAYLALLALLNVAGERSGPSQALQARQGRVLQAALQAMSSVDVAGLDGYQRGCYALLLRLNAAHAPAEERSPLLLQALGLLPSGVRRGERALLAVDLACLHAEDGEHELALGLLAEAEPDAVAAGDLGAATFASTEACRLLSLRGEATEAIAAAQRAVRYAEAGTNAVDVDQARRALIHALRDAGRGLEAAEIAELALREAELRLAAAGVHPGRPHPGGTGPGTGEVGSSDEAADAPPRPDVHLAATLAWAAAVCAEDLGERAVAYRCALSSAAWHARNGSDAARAEALEVAARTTGDPAEAAQLYAAAAEGYETGGHPWAATVCRRVRAFPLLEAEGLAAALQALDEAHLAVDAMPVTGDGEPSQRQRRVEWEHLALVEQAARVTAQDGQLVEALQFTADLGARYRIVGDLPSVWDVAALRARILDALERTGEGLPDLADATDEAADLDPARARGLADLLADLLEATGEDAAADDVRRRFELG